MIKNQSPLDNLSSLRRSIIENISFEEFKDLCFDLNINYDSLPGENTINAKTRELLQSVKRTNGFKELLMELSKLNSSINWSSFNKIIESNNDRYSKEPHREAKPVQSLTTQTIDSKYIVDRLVAVDLFESMVSGQSGVRILRLAGEAKMGKSHLLKEFRRRAIHMHESNCALIQLGGNLIDPPSILFAIHNQLRSLTFNSFLKAYDETTQQSEEFKTIDILIKKLSENLAETSQIHESRHRLITEAFLKDLKIQTDKKIVLCFDTLDNAPRIYHWFQEHFLSALCSLNNVWVIVAGRELPTSPISLEAECKDYELPPLEFHHYLEFKQKLGLLLSEEQLKTLFIAYEGRPGDIVDVADKFIVGLK